MPRPPWPASPLAQVRPDVPDALADLVARCLAKDREARPASMEEVARVLEAVSREHPWGEADARAWWESHPAGREAASTLR